MSLPPITVSAARDASEHPNMDRRTTDVNASLRAAAEDGLDPSAP